MPFGGECLGLRPVHTKEAPWLGHPYLSPDDCPSGSRGDWIRVGLCYPRGTTFSILSDVHNRLLKQTSKTGIFVKTSQMDKVEQSHPGRSHYSWDEDAG